MKSSWQDKGRGLYYLLHNWVGGHVNGRFACLESCRLHEKKRKEANIESRGHGIHVCLWCDESHVIYVLEVLYN